MEEKSLNGEYKEKEINSTRNDFMLEEEQKQKHEIMNNKLGKSFTGDESKIERDKEINEILHNNNYKEKLIQINDFNENDRFNSKNLEEKDKIMQINEEIIINKKFVYKNYREGEKIIQLGDKMNKNIGKKVEEITNNHYKEKEIETLRTEKLELNVIPEEKTVNCQLEEQQMNDKWVKIAIKDVIEDAVLANYNYFVYGMYLHESYEDICVDEDHVNRIADIYNKKKNIDW